MYIAGKATTQHYVLIHAIKKLRSEHLKCIITQPLILLIIDCRIINDSNFTARDYIA
jgi:hypothetical protein